MLIDQIIRYKNFKCTAHNKFFELNLYQKDPVNLHHWRADIARPADEIDLQATPKGSTMKEEVTVKIDKPEAKLGECSETKKEKNVEVLTLASTLGAAMLGDSYDGEDGEFSRGNYGGYDSECNGFDKDFTACSDSDCGYCGRCDY
jgi:hypothetical protein